MRVIEALEDLVEPNGTIAIMSSGQGSIANNERGGFEIYRGTKAALNMFMRSYAARHRSDPRTLLLMAPGWVKTRLGGPSARLTIDESIPTSSRLSTPSMDAAGFTTSTIAERLSPGEQQNLTAPRSEFLTHMVHRAWVGDRRATESDPGSLRSERPSPVR